MVESQFLKDVKAALQDPKAKPKEKPKTDIDAVAGPKKAESPTLPPPALAAKPESASPSPLALVERGRKFQPPRILLYGIDGIGKSEWASQASKPIFIQTEDGLGEIDCEKFPLARSFPEIIEQLDSVTVGKHDYETVVLDSLDWLERIIWENVCRRSNVVNIEKAGGGFAKGYNFALDEWREVLGLLDKCRARGMVVILIAHSKIERFEDPENPAYDRYSPRLHKHAEALVREWVDATFFATRRLAIRKEGAGFNERGVAIPVGTDGGERIIRTTGGPSCVAKTRYELPAELPMPKGQGWNVFVSNLKGA